MSRRILSVLVVLGLLFSTPVFAWQTGYETSVTRLNFKTYVRDNTTGAYQITDVSTAVIIPGTHIILGYAVMPLSTSFEGICSLYDGVGEANFIDETETTSALKKTEWFGYPKRLSTGLTIRQGAQTRVMVYYTTI